MIANRGVRHFDPVLVLIACVLVAYGGLLIYSASLNGHPTVGAGHPLVKQVVFAVLGLCAMAGIAWAVIDALA